MENLVNNIKKNAIIEIENKIRMCKRCELWKFKKNYVPGASPMNTILALGLPSPGT